MTHHRTPGNGKSLVTHESDFHIPRRTNASLFWLTSGVKWWWFCDAPLDEHWLLKRRTSLTHPFKFDWPKSVMMVHCVKYILWPYHESPCRVSSIVRHTTDMCIIITLIPFMMNSRIRWLSALFLHNERFTYQWLSFSLWCIFFLFSFFRCGIIICFFFKSLLNHEAEVIVWIVSPENKYGTRLFLTSILTIFI